MDESKLGKLEYLVIASVVILLALFFYQMRITLVQPFLTLILLLILLPLRRYNRFVDYLIGIVLFVFLIWFIREAGDILTPFVISFGLAYLFDPLISKLEKYKIPRWISVLTIVLVVLSLLALLLFLLIPQIIQEVQNLLSFSIEFPKRIADWVNIDGATLLTRLNLDVNQVQDYLQHELPSKIDELLEALLKALISLTNNISALIGQILNLVLIPFLFYYLLKDFSKIKAWLYELLPIETSWVVSDYFIKIDRIISGFFRGQLIVCLIVFALTSLGLMIFNIRYFLVLGVMAGVLNIIPYVGLAITLISGLLVGIASPNPWITCIEIIIVIEIVQVLESSFLSPRIVGDSVGLHPVWVIFSILVLSHFLGVFGLLVAVPIAATLKIFISQGLHKYRRSVWHKKNDENSTDS